MGHIEVEIKTDNKTDDDQERPSQAKPKSIFTTDVEEQLDEALGEQAAMDARDEQLARTKESSDLDLESEMEKDMNIQVAESDDGKQRDPADLTQETPGQESTATTDKDPRDPAQKSSENTTQAEVHKSEYGKQYVTNAQDRETRTAARREQQKQREEQERREKEEQAAKLAKEAEADEEARKVIEQASLRRKRRKQRDG